MDIIRRTFKRHAFSTPTVFCFNKEDKSAFESVKSSLKDDGFRLVDLNQALIVNPEDYNTPISEIGYNDPTGKLTINGSLSIAGEKKDLVIKGKLYKIENDIDENTVLVVEYNDQVLNNHTFFNTVRGWFKNGLRSRKPLRAIVYIETTKKFRDFCFYGTYISSDDEEEEAWNLV